MDLSILYEDNHLIVCLKTRGILSQASDMDLPDMVNILKDYLKEKYDKPGNVFLGLVHRLDLNVAGLMVFAKTSKAASRLSKQVRDHQFNKKYLAIAKESFEQETGTFIDYMMKDSDNRQAVIANESSGKLAKLKYRILDEMLIHNDTYSLVDVELISGRFHQIRFQFAHHNHPLLGDTKYGEQINNSDYFLGLYAYQIEFSHPITEEKLVFNFKPKHHYFLDFEGINKIDWRPL